MKRIVLCFDGTWNHPDADGIPEDRRVETNVRRFYRSVAPIGNDGVPQAPWYNEGIGVNIWDKLPAAFGAGLDKHIIDGYTHLVETYEDGDEVYILGFSRGAYTARSLVGLIRNCGLVRPGAFQLAWIGMAYGIYRTRDDKVDSVTAVSFRSKFARQIPIHFLGIWDTVGALGIPLGQLQEINRRYYQFHDAKLSKIVKNAYHAIAIDEHRVDYDVTLWSPNTPEPGQVLEQRWFVGAHCDVGGGYPDRQLSDIALRWMQDKATEAGLAVAPVGVSPANALGPTTDSFAAFLNGLYAERHTRNFRNMLQTTFGNEVHDDSVDVRRRDATLGYAPTNRILPPLI